MIKKNDMADEAYYKKKLEELGEIEKKLYGSDIFAMQFKRNPAGLNEVNEKINKFKNFLNSKDRFLNIIEEYGKKHGKITKDDFQKIFSDEEAEHIFWIIWQNEGKDISTRIESGFEEEKERCINIVPDDEDLYDLKNDWRAFVNKVNNKNYLKLLEEYANLYLSKEKIDKSTEFFKKYSNKFPETNIKKVYDALSPFIESNEGLRNNKIGKEIRERLSQIIYNRIVKK